MNSLYKQINPTKQLPNNIKQMINTFKGMSNPNAMVQQIMKNNPQLASLVEASNGDPEKSFRNLAQQMNVDPEEIIQMLR